MSGRWKQVTITERSARAWTRRFNEEVWGERNRKAVDELIAEDLIEHSSVSPTQARGPEGAKASIRTMLTAFPETAVELEDVVEDDRVAMRVTATGIHEGEFMGIVPTRREIEVPGIAIQRIEDGKAVEEWQVVDRLALLDQLGVVERSTGADGG